MKLIFLGAPGAGKGTQAELLSRRLHIPAISTGSILRTAVKTGTPIGKEAEVYMSAGKLVPDEVIIAITLERLQSADCSDGYILDGVPRTVAQAEAIELAGLRFDRAISLEITDEEILARMEGRRVCGQCGLPYHVTSMPPKISGICDVCGAALVRRGDDGAETVRTRLQVYHRETEPLKDFYAAQGILLPIKNRPTVAETEAAIQKALGI